MLPVNIPSADELLHLIDHRDAGSVSIYIPSSPLPRDTEGVQLALKNSIREASRQLEELEVPKKEIAAILDPLQRLDADEEFWRFQAHSLAVFAAPGVLHTYRLANRVQDHVAVGDRFDLGSVLRAVTFPHGGYVLGVSEGAIALFELGPESDATLLDLPGLPDDLHTLLETTATDGQFDRHRARGDTGERLPRERFCRAVQKAVLERIDDRSLPLILSATPELEPAYRVINEYSGLLEQGLDLHPSALDAREADARGRRILDEHYSDELRDWRERFGDLGGSGRAASDLAEVARAATSGAMLELLFDMDATTEGQIDEQGTVAIADEEGPNTYNLVDEIAARVLRSGGEVRAVRAEDLLNGSPVAAILRYALTS